MTKLGLDQLDPRGRKVLMRVDFNVPFDKAGQITDDTRITAALPSVRKILDGGGAVVLMSHLGRPKGEIKPEYSLRPVADRLAQLIDVPVKFATDTVGADATARVRELKPGEVILLENLRFNAGETKNDPAFAKALAALGDAYVNDAFGSAHRAHASTEGIAHCFKRAYAGLLMQAEVEHLGSLLDDPQRPFVAVLGGAKVDSKVDVIRNLSAACRHPAARRRHDLHVLQEHGLRHRFQSARRTELARGGGDPQGSPKRAARNWCCRRTWSSPPISVTRASAAPSW